MEVQSFFLRKFIHRCYTVVYYGYSIKCGAWDMRKEQLTVAEALKFARHDFLNELQLILMHIDFGDTLKARQAIMNTTDKMKQASMLYSLGLPKTEQWLVTFDWVHTAFQKTLSCTIERGSRKVNDIEVVAYLERVFQDVENVLDPASEYEVQIDVQASPSNWSICIKINSALDGKRNIPAAQIESFLVEEKIEENLWMFTISGQ